MPEGQGDAGNAAESGQQGQGQNTGQPPPPPPPPPPPGDGTDWKAEFEKKNKEFEDIRTAMRRAEDRARAGSQAAKELETLRRQTMSDTERAVAEAKETVRAEVLKEVAAERVSSRIATYAAGRLDPAAAAVISQRLDPTGFINEDGSVDDEAIAKFINEIAPPTQEPPPDPRFPDLGQGQRNTAQALNDDGLEGALRRALNVP